MRHILAYYWSASTGGLTVNKLAIIGDVFHEWGEEQQGLRRIIPLNTNAIFSLMLWHRRTYATFASSHRELGWVPGKAIGRGFESQQMEKDLKFESTGVGLLKH